jgi:hypothetical protein
MPRRATPGEFHTWPKQVGCTTGVQFGSVVPLTIPIFSGSVICATSARSSSSVSVPFGVAAAGAAVATCVADGAPPASAADTARRTRTAATPAGDRKRATTLMHPPLRVDRRPRRRRVGARVPDLRAFVKKVS